MALEDRARVTHPLNGEEYLENLKDGREVWIHGERVENRDTIARRMHLTRLVKGG